MVTLARGRRRHLERQALAVAALDPAPDAYLLVSLDAAEPARATSSPALTVVHRPVAAGAPLPLAAARNAAIAAASAGGAELVLCLDADCLPGPEALGHLQAAAAARPGALLAGPVGRLGPLPAGTDEPTPEHLARARGAAGLAGRPVPAPGEVLDEPRVERFWSLSFGVAPVVHERIGGFDEGYVGYGAEDTDYAFRARAAGVPLTWVGGAWAYHQHHPVSSPPTEHLAEIVGNARRFHDRWGRWPMEGWLAAFAAAGLVGWEPEADRLELLAPG